MNKLILFLVSVIFTSCSSYYYTATPQSYTEVAVVEPLEEEEVISSQIYPVITFTNWNVYSNYWDNYFYTPYYIAPSVAWSFNSPYNYTWGVSYWRPWRWNSWNNWYGYNNWYGFNSWNHPYNNWYGFNSWNHPYNNWYGFNSWNHPYNNWYGCGNNYFFNNTYITNNYGHGLNGGKIFAPNNNGIGSGSFTNGKLANNYTSVPVTNVGGKVSQNLPTRPADKYTSVQSVRSNDIRNYQTSNSQSVRENSTRPEVRSNEIRSYQTPSRVENSNLVRENSYSPSKVESRPRVETPTRVESIYQPRTESYTRPESPSRPSRVETPRNNYSPRTESYTRPESPSRPSRVETPRNNYSPRQSSPQRNSYSPRQSSPSYSSPSRGNYSQPRQSSPSRSSSPGMRGSRK